MKKVYVPKSMKEKKMQRALLQYKNPRNYDLVHEALSLAGRLDLIGNDKKCLIKERSSQGKKRNQQGPKRQGKPSKNKKNQRRRR